MSWYSIELYQFLRSSFWSNFSMSTEDNVEQPGLGNLGDNRSSLKFPAVIHVIKKLLAMTFWSGISFYELLAHSLVEWIVARMCQDRRRPLVPAVNGQKITRRPFINRPQCLHVCMYCVRVVFLSLLFCQKPVPQGRGVYDPEVYTLYTRVPFFSINVCI